MTSIGAEDRLAGHRGQCRTAAGAHAGRGGGQNVLSATVSGACTGEGVEGSNPFTAGYCFSR